MNRAGGSYLGSLLFGLGLLAIYAGERLIGSGTARGVTTGLGVALVLAGLGFRVLRWLRAEGEARRAEGLLLALTATGLLALGAYLLQTLLADASWPQLTIALAALWPALLLCALVPLLLVELAYAAMAQAPVVESGRLREALFSGLGLAFAVIFAFATVYVFTVRDTKWDLSYFRTARPGTAALNLVASLEEPVDVYLFFPPANDVREELRGYFDDLARHSPNIRVHDLDQAVDLARARELGVTGNGTVVLARGGRKEKIQFGQRLEQARTQLRNLDRDAQKALLKVARSKRVVYLTTGHGERAEKREDPSDQRSPTTLMRELLAQQNYEVRPLGPAEGLAIDVPQDAAAVMMLGPTRQPLEEELASLTRYLERGGRLVVALEPESPARLDPLFAPLGLRYLPVTLANDQVSISRRGLPSERTWLVVASYSPHPSVTTLSGAGTRLPMVLLGAGAFEQTPDRPANVQVDFTVHAHAATWNDVDGDFQIDPPAETRKSWELAAALTRKPRPDAKPEEQGRLVVLGDSDALSDAVIENAGNAYFLLDALRWLAGEESLAGETVSEVDVPVQHTRKQDVAWFYSTVFLVPAVILGAGFFATRRRRKAARIKEGGR